MSKIEYLDCTDQPDPENIRRIIDYLGRLGSVPGAALDALEGLLKVAYPGAETIYHCRICGAPISVPQTPGKKPTDLCKKTDCQRQANRERVARYRAKQRTIAAR